MNPFLWLLAPMEDACVCGTASGVCGLSIESGGIYHHHHHHHDHHQRHATTVGSYITGTTSGFVITLAHQVHKADERREIEKEKEKRAPYIVITCNLAKSKATKRAFITSYLLLNIYNHTLLLLLPFPKTNANRTKKRKQSSKNRKSWPSPPAKCSTSPLQQQPPPTPPSSSSTPKTNTLKELSA